MFSMYDEETCEAWSLMDSNDSQSFVPMQRPNNFQFLRAQLRESVTNADKSMTDNEDASTIVAEDWFSSSDSTSSSSYEVPDSVRSAYQNPEPLLPNLDEVVRLRGALEEQVNKSQCCSHCELNPARPVAQANSDNVTVSTSTNARQVSVEEKDLFVSAVIKMQLDYARQFNLYNEVSLTETQKASTNEIENVPKLELESSSKAQALEPLNGASCTELQSISVCNGDKDVNGHPKYNNDVIVLNDETDLLAVNGEQPIHSNPNSETELEPQRDEDCRISVPSSASTSLITVKSELSQELQSPVKSQLEQMKTDESSASTPNSRQLSSIRREPPTASEIDCPSEPPGFVKTLLSRWKNRLTGMRRGLPLGIHGILVPLFPSQIPSQTITRQTTLIGLGPGVHVNLLRYKHCNFLSDLHAHIRFNTVYHRFELCNISSYGTIVNRVRYGPESSNRQKYLTFTNRLTDVNTVFENRRRELLERIERQSKEGGCSNDVMVSCSCLSENETISSWEGPAALLHGSLVTFGCLAFVFTIIDIRNKGQSSFSFNREILVPNSSAPSTSGIKRPKEPSTSDKNEKGKRKRSSH